MFWKFPDAYGPLLLYSCDSVSTPIGTICNDDTHVNLPCFARTLFPIAVSAKGHSQTRRAVSLYVAGGFEPVSLYVAGGLEPVSLYVAGGLEPVALYAAGGSEPRPF